MIDTWNLKLPLADRLLTLHVKLSCQHSNFIKKNRQHKLQLENNLDEILDNSDFEIFNDHNI
jgi:hypothetical protein